LTTVAGLISTQATRTQAGSRLPTAIECNIVATIKQKPTPVNMFAHALLRFQHVGYDVGQGAVVADAAGEHEGNAAADAFEHDAAFNGALVDRGLDAADAANGIDRSQMVFVAFLGGKASIHRHAQAGAVKRLLEVVRGQGIAGEENIEIAFAYEPANVLAAASVDDRRPEHCQDLVAGFARAAHAAAISRTVTPLGFSLETGLDMNSNRLLRASSSAGKTRTPRRPTAMRSPLRTSTIGTQRAAPPSGSMSTPQSIS